MKMLSNFNVFNNTGFISYKLLSPKIFIIRIKFTELTVINSNSSASRLQDYKFNSHSWIPSELKETRVGKRPKQRDKMAFALKANTSPFLSLNHNQSNLFRHNQSSLFCPNYTYNHSHSVVSIISKSYKPPMAALSTSVGSSTVGLSETFARLKQQGKVSV